MAFENCVVPEDWRCAVIVPLCKGKGEKTECKNYRSIIYQLVKCGDLGIQSPQSDWGFYRRFVSNVKNIGCVGGKLLSGIKSMHVDSSPCVRVKGGETIWR